MNTSDLGVTLTLLFHLSRSHDLVVSCNTRRNKLTNRIQSDWAYLSGFGENDDVISLGWLDVWPNVAELVVGHPARSLGVIRRCLLQHLLAVQCQVLEVRITGERIAEVRHDDGCDEQKVDEKTERTRTLRNSSPRTARFTQIRHTEQTSALASFDKIKS